MDMGHEDLIKDLQMLLDEAKAKEFHDFENEAYPAPKVSLVNLLKKLQINVTDGKYDN